MRNKFFIIAALLLSAAAINAETMILEDESPRQAPVPGATAVKTAVVKPAATAAIQPAQVKPAVTAAVQPTQVKPAPTAQPTQFPAEDLKPRIEALKNSLDAIKTQAEANAALVKEMQENLKKVESRSLETQTTVENLDLLKSKVLTLEEKGSETRASIEKYSKDFDSMKESVKSNVDKLQGWNDILEVLKKQINDNELEVAKIKKTINDVKGKYGDQDENMFSSILKWPYAGFTALVISIVALSVAIAK